MAFDNDLGDELGGGGIVQLDPSDDQDFSFLPSAGAALKRKTIQDPKINEQ